MFVYLITNTANGKFYVGKTVQKDLQKYLEWNFQDANSNNPKVRRGKPYLYNAMRKYGRNNFSIHALMSTLTTNQELCRWERTMIALLRSQDTAIGYNIADGGEGFTSDGFHPMKVPEYAAKNAAARRGQLRPDVLGDKNPMRRPEVKAKMTGVNNPFHGRTHTSDSLRKMADKMKGRVQSPEHVAKRVASRKGYRHSEETRAKILESNRIRRESELQ